MHLLMEELREIRHIKKRFKVLAKNGERFRTLTLGRFKIQDSLEHMPASLDALVKDLGQLENFEYPIVQQMSRFQRLKPRRRKKGLKMLTRKGIFCYEHYASLHELQSASALPPREAFYSTLNEEAVSESDYQFAKDMYAFFQCANVLDYMMLYCSLDVALLCETFLQYRKMVRRHFHLDPAHYLGKAKFAVFYFFTVSVIYHVIFGRNSRIKFRHYVKDLRRWFGAAFRS